MILQFQLGMNPSHIYPQGKEEDPVVMEKSKKYVLNPGDIITFLPACFGFQLRSPGEVGQPSPLKRKCSELQEEEEQVLNKKQKKLEDKPEKQEQEVKEKLLLEVLHGWFLQAVHQVLKDVYQLKEMFVGQPEEVIMVALAECQGDKEKAIEWLLNPPPNPMSLRQSNDGIQVPAANVDPNKDAEIAAELEKALRDAEEQKLKLQR